MDVGYWDNFYRSANPSIFPTTFSQYCLQNYIKNDSILVDLGCGNGRDSFFFCRELRHVFAIDQSKAAIEGIKSHSSNLALGDKLTAIQSDFTSYDFSVLKKVDIFYSRFTLHSMTHEQEKRLLSNILDTLDAESMLLIEARTIKDPLYGSGKQIGLHEYVTDHYRRFIDSDVFLDDVSAIGYRVESFMESNDLSIVSSDNPVLMRVVLRTK